MRGGRHESSIIASEYSHSYYANPYQKAPFEQSSVGEAAVATRTRTTRVLQPPPEVSQRGSQMTQTQKVLFSPLFFFLLSLEPSGMRSDSRQRRESRERDAGERKPRRRSDDKRRRSRSRERGTGRDKRRKDKSPSLPRCDEEGHLVTELGCNLTERYKVLDYIGVGTFGKVLECWDRKHKSRVAVKVVRNVKVRRFFWAKKSRF